MHQEMIFSEFSSRELGERAIFRFFVKAAAVVLVGILEWLILSNIPSDMPLQMRAVIWFVLAFTMAMLCIAFLCESKVVRMHATILFGLGACVIIIGILTGIFLVS